MQIQGIVFKIMTASQKLEIIKKFMGQIQKETFLINRIPQQVS